MTSPSPRDRRRERGRLAGAGYEDRPALRVVGQARDGVGLPIGTRVRKDRTGFSACTGTVMPHAPEYSRGSFPVCFDDGLWEVLNASEVTVLAPSEGGSGHG